MGRYVKSIIHKGKETLFMDGPGLDDKVGIEAWDEMGQELAKNRSNRLILVDTTGTGTSIAMLNKVKLVADTIKGGPGNRVAFKGLTVLQRSTAQIHARSVGINAHFCNTLEEGREWLVNEEKKRR